MIRMDYSQESQDSDNYEFDDHQSEELMGDDLTITDDFDDVGRGSCISRNSNVTVANVSNVKDSGKRIGNQTDNAPGSSGDKRSLRPKSARYGCRPGSMLAAHEASTSGGGATPKTQSNNSTNSSNKVNRKFNIESSAPQSNPSSASSSLTSGSSPTSGLSFGSGDVKNMATEYLDDVVHSGGLVVRPQSSRKTSPGTGRGYYSKKAAAVQATTTTGARMRNGIPPVSRQGRPVPVYEQQPQNHYTQHQQQYRSPHEPRDDMDDSGEDMVLYSQRHEEDPGDRRALYESVLNATGQKVLDKLKDRQRMLSNLPSAGGASYSLSGSDSASKSGQYGSRKLQPLQVTKLGYRHN